MNPSRDSNRTRLTYRTRRIKNWIIDQINRIKTRPADTEALISQQNSSSSPRYLRTFQSKLELSPPSLPVIREEPEVTPSIITISSSTPSTKYSSPPPPLLTLKERPEETPSIITISSSSQNTPSTDYSHGNSIFYAKTLLNDKAAATRPSLRTNTELDRPGPSTSQNPSSSSFVEIDLTAESNISFQGRTSTLKRKRNLTNF